VCILAALAGRSEAAVLGMNGRPPLWGNFPIAAALHGFLNLRVDIG